MAGNFNPPYSAPVFWCGAAATLLCFSMTTSQALLPVVMAAQGLDESVVGFAMAATGLSAIAFGVIAGLMVSRYGALVPILLGTAIMLGAHVSYELVPKTGLAITLLRFFHGTGAGLFLPATISFATSMLRGENRTLMFGIFTSSIPGANLIGPPLGEAYLSRFGPDGFFTATAVPGLLALVVYAGLLLRFGRQKTDYKVHFEYVELLKRRDLFQPILGMIIVGSLWGYVISFLAVALSAQGVPLSLFFIPMTLSMFFGRFVILALTRGWQPETVGMVSIAATALALVVVGLVGVHWVTVLAGVAFGAGYSLAYPTFNIWISSTVEDRSQGQAVALANTVFNFFMYFAPAFCAVGLSVLSILQYQILLATVLLAAATFVAFGGSRTR